MAHSLSYFTFLVLFAGIANYTNGQTIPHAPQSLEKRDLWTAKDLIQPKDLASILANKKAKQPIVLNIGVVEDILGSQNIGAASKKENLKKLEGQLKKLNKSSFIVIYCGCCPFDKCPNIRPAFNLLKGMGFSRARLLNLPTNIKQDWIAKGYPLKSGK